MHEHGGCCNNQEFPELSMGSREIVGEQTSQKLLEGVVEMEIRMASVEWNVTLWEVL